MQYFHLKFYAANISMYLDEYLNFCFLPKHICSQKVPQQPGIYVQIFPNIFILLHALNVRF